MEAEEAMDLIDGDSSSDSDSASESNEIVRYRA